jgi:hypothetical protein
MDEKALSGIQAGVSGEYFVAAELSRRGYSCSITIKNTKGVDILVSSPNSKKLIGIQVKSNQTTRKAWVLNEKAEEFIGDNLFYVFADNVGEPNTLPVYYIVPSGEVADQVKEGHREWLEKPGIRGQAHQDNPIRKFRDDEQKHRDGWHLIEDALRDA